MNSPAAEEGGGGGGLGGGGTGEERGVCNGYVTAVSVALSRGARTVSIKKI